MVKIDPVYIGLTRDYIFMDDNEHYRMIYSHLRGETSFFNRAFVSGYGDEAPSNSECDHNGYTQQFDEMCHQSLLFRGSILTVKSYRLSLVIYTYMSPMQGNVPLG